MRLRPVLLAAVFALTIPIMAQAGDRRGDPVFQTQSVTIARNGMAATAHPLASQAAIEILKAGGSAVDAAIAANAMLGLVEPTGNGIGGDLFALIYDPKLKTVVSLDASGFAPKDLDIKALRKRNPNGVLFDKGMDSVTIPGAVAGWAAMHEKYGKLPLDQVLAPAIRYAKEGFPVSTVISRLWKMNLDRFAKAGDKIEANQLINTLYAPSGQAPAEGEIFTNPDLAKTYEIIGKSGAKGFYSGDFAADFEQHFKAYNRPHKASDLALMQAEWVQPIKAAYRDVILWQIPPATQGITTLQMASILNQFDMAKLSEADRIHLLVEAKKLAFADRAKYVADPRHVKLPIEQMISAGYAKERAKLIRMDQSLPDQVPAGDPEGEKSDTTYLTTSDKDGFMVSLIQSNYAGMGSGIIVPRRDKSDEGRGTWGFMLQNRGAQFALDPKANNVVAPLKRPFHTIIPGMATKYQDGQHQPFLSFGVMGGTMQPQGQVQILINILDLKMNLQAAGDAPRVRHLGSPDPGADDGKEPTPGIYIESGIGKDTRAALQAKGQNIVEPYQDVGGYQAIMWDAKNKVWHGATEMRKDGAALGY